MKPEIAVEFQTASADKRAAATADQTNPLALNTPQFIAYRIEPERATDIGSSQGKRMRTALAVEASKMQAGMESGK